MVSTISISLISFHPSHTFVPNLNVPSTLSKQIDDNRLRGLQDDLFMMLVEHPVFSAHFSPQPGYKWVILLVQPEGIKHKVLGKHLPLNAKLQLNFAIKNILGVHLGNSSSVL